MRDRRPPWAENVAALERSDNVADRGHAFALLKRGYPRRIVLGQETDAAPAPAFSFLNPNARRMTLTHESINLS